MDTESNTRPSFQPDLNGVLIWNPQPTEGETVLWEGPANNNYAEGSGLLTWYWQGAIVSVYQGVMVAGKPHGQGKYSFADGDKYEGEWVEGLRHGYGRQWYRDGRYYEGLWEQDKPTGPTSI